MLVVSGIQYVTDTTPRPETFPFIFNDPNVSGSRARFFRITFAARRAAPPGFTPPLTAAAAAQKQQAITTNFSSKSEGALHLSVDGHYLTYMGYNARSPVPLASTNQIFL